MEGSRPSDTTHTPVSIKSTVITALSYSSGLDGSVLKPTLRLEDLSLDSVSYAALIAVLQAELSIANEDALSKAIFAAETVGDIVETCVGLAPLRQDEE